MTLAQDLTARYQAGLREQSEPLAEEFAAAAEALVPLAATSAASAGTEARSGRPAVTKLARGTQPSRLDCGG